MIKGATLTGSAFFVFKINGTSRAHGCAGAMCAQDVLYAARGHGYPYAAEHRDMQLGTAQ